MAGFAVVDVETTGLNPSSDRIIEIDVVALDAEGEFEDEWTSLVNPLRPVAAQFVHGISDDDVAGAPTFTELLPHIATRLEGRAIAAHNAAFDVGFLNASFKRARFPMEVPLDATVCTMELSKIYLPEGRHGLVSASERAGITLSQHHRALADAWTAAQLLRVYLRAEEQGRRYLERATSRTGRVTSPASWIEAQLCARSLTWPVALF
ncbi:3'-5' exonuclease [Actinomycetaceae bacterium L2_0104]